MKNNIREIGINDLLLDHENARYGGTSVENQRKAIEQMFKIKDMDKKIYNLAAHIAEHGLDPSELPLVITISGKQGKSPQYLAPDGNRRILAIKLLHNPSLSPTNSYRKKIEKLTSSSVKRSLSEIQCSVVRDRGKADVWVGIKHTGENEGVGRVNWDGTAKDVHRVRTGKKKTAGRQILDYIGADNDFSSEIKSKIDQVDITNLTRLFQGSPAKRKFGLIQKNGFLESKNPLSDFRGIAECVVERMLEDDFNVKQIYHKEDQEKFIRDKIPNNILPTPESLLSDSQTWRLSNLDTKTLTKEQKEGLKPKRGGTDKPTRPKSQSQNRKRLIDFSLKVTSKRINKIYYELKNELDVHSSPNAVAVLFRVFLELTCDSYFSKNKIKRKDTNKPLTRDDKLIVKVEHIVNYLEENRHLNKDQARTIRKRASAKNELVSVDSLNEYIHASGHSPIPTELNILMDNWAPSFKAIWK